MSQQTAETSVVDQLIANTQQIDVYVCPTEGCDDYYGASGMPKLEEVWNARADTTHDTKSDPFGKPEELHTHTRAECPTCRIRGIHVERVRRIALVLPSPDVDEHIPPVVN